MARAGLTTSRSLAAKRKYAVVFSFIGAAIITPPDVISQVGLAIPIIVLYEVSIVAVRAVERKRKGLDDDYEEEKTEETDFNLT